MDERQKLRRNRENGDMSWLSPPVSPPGPWATGTRVHVHGQPAKVVRRSEPKKPAHIRQSDWEQRDRTPIYWVCFEDGSLSAVSIIEMVPEPADAEPAEESEAQT